MTISLGHGPSFRPTFGPIGEPPAAAGSRTLGGAGSVDSFERVGGLSEDRSQGLAQRAGAHREANLGRALGAVAAVGLMALFFANPLVGTAAILLSATGVLGAAVWTSR